MLIAAGGLSTLIGFIEQDYDNNISCTMIAIDAVKSLTETNCLYKNDLVMLLLKWGILERFVLMLDYFRNSTDKPQDEYFDKILDLLLTFSSQDKYWIKETFSNSDIMKAILTILNSASEINKRHLGKMVRIIRNLSTNTTKETLYKLGIVKTLIHVYDILFRVVEENRRADNETNVPEADQIFDESMCYEVLNLIHTHCMMSSEPWEQATNTGFISLIYKTINLGIPVFNKIMLDLLISFINVSETMREQMWNSVNGPHLLIVLLNMKDHASNAKVLDALVSWLKLDPDKIEKYLCDTENFNDILKFSFNFKYAYNIQEYWYVLNSIKAIIAFSDKVSKFISRKKELVSKIVKQLYEILSFSLSKNEQNMGNESAKGGSHYYSQSSAQPGSSKLPYNLQVGHNLTQVLRDLLEIIELLIEKCGVSPRRFIERHKLQQPLLSIYQLAQNQGLVILEGLSAKILSSMNSPENVINN